MATREATSDLTAGKGGQGEEYDQASEWIPDSLESLPDTRDHSFFAATFASCETCDPAMRELELSFTFTRPCNGATAR